MIAKLLPIFILRMSSSLDVRELYDALDSYSIDVVADDGFNVHFNTKPTDPFYIIHDYPTVKVWYAGGSPYVWVRKRGDTYFGGDPLNTSPSMTAFLGLDFEAELLYRLCQRKRRLIRVRDDV